MNIKFNLAKVPLESEGKAKNFFLKFEPVCHPERDLYKEYFSKIGRDNHYLLCSMKYEEHS